MKKDKALEVMGYIDPNIIDEAEIYKRTKKKNTWVTWAATAACFCLVAASALILNNRFRSSNVVTNNPAGKIENVSENPTNGKSQDQGQTATDVGLYIPVVEVPKSSDGVAYDIIGLVVYNGGVYTQAENYHGAEAEKIENLLGEHLGHASGSITEWSTQEEYAEEFASSVEGEVYEVLGYDKSFRICVKREVEGENGKELFIEFLDHLNGITLTTGADLFESRLQIRGRVDNIRWQSHNDWDYNLGNIQTVAIDPALWEEFLEQIDAADFVNTWDPEITTNTVYDTENQAHVFLNMKDGTTIRLRLIEGGYVGYDALGWYFVQIPGETFDAVFSACGGNK